MQFPKLTPLQSRFAASLAASGALVIIYLYLWSPRFAYALELDVRSETRVGGGEDHNWARLVEDWGVEREEDGLVEDDLRWEDEEDKSNWKDEGDRIDRPTLAKRIPDGVNPLQGSNYPGALNINPGETQYWVFLNASLWGNHTNPGPGLPVDPAGQASDQTDDADSGDTDTIFRRETGHDLDTRQAPRQEARNRTVYISVNTCLQPAWNATSVQTVAPPQLTLYVSNSTRNQKPNANMTARTQIVLPLQEGFANYSMNATGDIYMSMAAPDLPQDFSGIWNYNLAVSIDAYYHSSHSNAFLHLVDTDTNSALLVTDNLTQTNPGDPVYQKWMNISAPYIVFAQNKNEKSTLGLSQSFCGLQSAPDQIMADTADPAGESNPVQMGMVTRGLDNKPKQQFFIKSLNASSSYGVFLAMYGNSTAHGAGVVGGGGQVWPSVDLTTKQSEYFPTTILYLSQKTVILTTHTIQTATVP